MKSFPFRSILFLLYFFEQILKVTSFFFIIALFSILVIFLFFLKYCFMFPFIVQNPPIPTNPDCYLQNRHDSAYILHLYLIQLTLPHECVHRIQKSVFYLMNLLSTNSFEQKWSSSDSILK